jgi:hypothetical protein
LLLTQPFFLSLSWLVGFSPPPPPTAAVAVLIAVVILVVILLALVTVCVVRHRSPSSVGVISPSTTSTAPPDDRLYCSPRKLLAIAIAPLRLRTHTLLSPGPDCPRRRRPNRLKNQHRPIQTREPRAKADVKSCSSHESHLPPGSSTCSAALDPRYSTSITLDR